MQEATTYEPAEDVLIAPLWNWNLRISVVPLAGMMRSNRTFMELKYVELQQGADVRSSSNRTFMELKLTSAFAPANAALVLIAPLWNWNADYRTPIPQGMDGSNRTFMELKLHQGSQGYAVGKF